VETDRAGIVVGKVGHTAKKVDELVTEALDGVLFIDEAYTLKIEGAKNDFGQEAIDTLLTRMEIHK
jgi:DNA helicase TIP49 (TBP-interacting protein)